MAIDYEKPPETYQWENPAEVKIANKVEYIAHQAFHIRRALERIAETLEAKP